MNMSVELFRCSCFFTGNFFSNLLQRHFRFVDKQNFLRDYGHQLGLTPSSKSASPVNIDDVIAELEEERGRRKGLSAEIVRRRKEILDSYIPKQPQLYAFRASFLAPEFVRLVDRCRGDKSKLDLVAQLEADATLDFKRESSHYAQVFSFPVFTKDFCLLLLEELGHFESSPLPKGRPNTMNRRGVLLDELLNFDEGFVDVFRTEYIQPVVERLIPGYDRVGLDSQKAFTVSYREGEDVELSYHYDNAEVTLNVCLGSDFTDGELYFGDVKRWGETYDAKQVSDRRSVLTYVSEFFRRMNVDLFSVSAHNICFGFCICSIFVQDGIYSLAHPNHPNHPLRPPRKTKRLFRIGLLYSRFFFNSIVDYNS